MTRILRPVFVWCGPCHPFKVGWFIERRQNSFIALVVVLRYTFVHEKLTWCLRHPLPLKNKTNLRGLGDIYGCPWTNVPPYTTFSGRQSFYSHVKPYNVACQAHPTFVFMHLFLSLSVVLNVSKLSWLEGPLLWNSPPYGLKVWGVWSACTGGGLCWRHRVPVTRQ